MAELPPKPESHSPAQETPASTDPGGWRFVKFLYTQNPFYLLSVCFVLHGTGLQMNDAHQEHQALPLFLLICSYILMMSLTAVTIIRKARLWEDARSILLLVPLLLVELSLTLDDPLITDPLTGRLLVIAAALFSSAVFELLLRGLQLRLPRLYRVPLHALMALMILYPLAIIPAIHHEGLQVSVPWRNFLFGPLAALVILTLIPAIRRGAGYVKDNGTPWGWPLYPWTLFVFLIGAVAARGYSFTLSFDPVLDQSLSQAMTLESTWGWYHAAPILLAVAALLMEFGVVTKRKSVSAVAMCLPVATCLLILWEGNQSLVYRNFLKEFTQTLASPLFLTLSVSAAFYLIAMIRRQPLALQGFSLTFIAFGLVGPETTDLNSLTTFQSITLMIAGCLALTRGLLSHSSGLVLLGITGICAWIDWELVGYWSHFTLLALTFHSLLAGLLLCGLCFNDQLAPDCLLLGSMGLVAAPLAALFAPLPFPEGLPEWSLYAYSLTMAGIALAIAYPMRLPPFVYMGGAIMIATLLDSGRLLVRELQQILDIRGLSSFAIGFLLMLLGIVVSAAKAGLLKRLKVLIPRPPD